jgi:hypothetical protein
VRSILRHAGAVKHHHAQGEERSDAKSQSCDGNFHSVSAKGMAVLVVALPPLIFAPCKPITFQKTPALRLRQVLTNTCRAENFTRTRCLLCLAYWGVPLAGAGGGVDGAGADGIGSGAGAAGVAVVGGVLTSVGAASGFAGMFNFCPTLI